MNIKITPKEQIQYVNCKSVHVGRKLVVSNERKCSDEIVCKFSLKFDVDEYSCEDLDVLNLYLYLNELEVMKMYVNILL